MRGMNGSIVALAVDRTCEIIPTLPDGGSPFTPMLGEFLYGDCCDPQGFLSREFGAFWFITNRPA
jgi:hypothetical protein